MPSTQYLSKYGHTPIQSVPILRLPSTSQPPPPDNAEPTQHPHPCHHACNHIHQPRPPLPFPASVISTLGDIFSPQLQPLCRPAHEMPAAHGHERAVP